MQRGWGVSIQRDRFGVGADEIRIADPLLSLCTSKVPMSVDTYAICPCGSGKKIKFCKCKDSVGELDRVLKMVEGGQVVPALDRLSSVLKEHPDAAWALAIRGRLLLDLREYESLSENADRFIRLQPSNPLALTQRAAARLFRGEVDQAVDSLLEALTESGKDVDSFVLDVASVLAYSLAQSGAFLTARAYASLALTAQGYEEGQTSVEVLRQLNSSSSVSQLIKSIPELIERPSDVDWGERYDEAVGLLRSNKVVLAQTKLEALQRSAPAEPAVLSGLLSCAIWRGEVEAQSDCLRKLSQCETLEMEQRFRFGAMAAVVPPSTPELAVQVTELRADVDDPEQAEMAMAADSRFVALPGEMLPQLKPSEDAVPPRAGFQLIDRDPPDTDQLPPVDEMPEAIAMVLLYGKQTDQAAQIHVLDVRSGDVQAVRDRLTETIENLQVTEEPGDTLPLVVACNPQVAMIRFKGQRSEAEALQTELVRRRMPSNIASLPLPLLGNRSLAETAGDDTTKFERTVLLRAIEHYDVIVSKGDSILAELYQLAQVEPRPPIELTVEGVETVANEDLNRVDPGKLDADSLIYLLQRAQQVSATPAIRRFANALIDTDLNQEQKPARLLAYMALVNSATQVSEALAALEKAKEFAEANEVPISRLLLTEANLRLQAGDADGFQRAVETLTNRYGNDPEAMAQLQQMLMMYGLIRPDGSPRSAARGPAEASPLGGAPAPAAAPANPGLWTPEGTAPPPGQTPPAKEGGSKLWVPGMD